MSATKVFFLLAVLLLLTHTSWAQSRPESKPTAPAVKPMTVSVELPRAVGLLSDCAQILFSGQEEDEGKLSRLVDRIRTRREKPVVHLEVEVPRNKVTRSLGITE
jgi:hypothetical protein